MKFECQIVDQYEDEYFISVMDPLKDAPANLQPMVYKYFSELKDAQADQFDLTAEPT